ncbi:hypothetical protein R69658_05850 [Paraburkholderia aspalathi]|uniref:Uncharacterized protein n=1 Tax=Paraburkholderia aspalathi TaxID=1324617 RepID=A0ABM8SMU4_9BURK|nr:hypothetical protein [Paraburkholderia aspalathi]MBK3822152.1 hypothetical protein [Paraburkholderia aspalathi]MBK3833986.1 hypothetical protein [Paraburkholderia aspalathi]MBK3863719.1 hypothetical protein [Paraburkholderia aspalathi]CAE6821034.1 hypothetical protein R69658_05850 [Paraburkholderia aspalathi]
MTLPDEAQLRDVFMDIALEPHMLAPVMALQRNPDLAEIIESCVRHLAKFVALKNDNTHNELLTGWKTQSTIMPGSSVGSKLTWWHGSRRRGSTSTSTTTTNEPET